MSLTRRLWPTFRGSRKHVGDDQGTWRSVAVGLLTVALAGCKVVPDGPAGPAPRADSGSRPERRRAARPIRRATASRLLVPLSGDNAAVGRSIANATTMALLDTNAENLRITTYDTATGAGSAAQRAIADGNKLILGPAAARGRHAGARRALARRACR